MRCHFKNGWLLAYDAGEWGGGLWLTNEDGSRTKRILNDNVRGVVPIDGGIFVLSGLAHMSINFGNAFIFSNPDGLDITLQHSVHLDGSPVRQQKSQMVLSFSLRRMDCAESRNQESCSGSRIFPSGYPNSIQIQWRSPPMEASSLRCGCLSSDFA